MFLGKMYSKKERTVAVREFDGAPDTDATITIKLLSPGERRKVAMAGFHTTFSPDEQGNMNPEMTANNWGAQEALFHKAVIGWTGFYADDAGKKELKFGLAGKKMLLDVWPDLAVHVANVHDEMVTELEAAREEEEKN